MKSGSAYLAVLCRDDASRTVFYPEVTLNGALRRCFYPDISDLALVRVAATDPFGSRTDD